MNLQQTIADLEKQAAKYTEAANALRELQSGESSSAKALGRVPMTRRGRKPAGVAKAGGRKGGKRVVSAETRAKLAEAMRRRHQQRKQSAK
jgi:hypothetical protein